MGQSQNSEGLQDNSKINSQLVSYQKCLKESCQSLVELFFQRRMTVSRLVMCGYMVIVANWGISCTSDNKRLVLHSDVDMAASIQALTARLEAMSAELVQLTAQNQKLAADVQTLNVQNSQLVANVQTLHGHTSQLASDVQTLNLQNSQLVSDVQTLKTTSFDGSVYTRWGRTTCPQNGSELIYAGFSGGNTYDKNGAADYICLSGDPLWGVYDDSAQASALKIYGTEYEFLSQFSDGGARFFGQNLHDHDAPCAVCRSSRPTTVMIPGRNQCYPGWTMEYAGYLVSGLDVQASPTNYACLDANSEWEVGDGESKNGKLMYLVEAACGSLRCPPYVENREITCVVCSK